MRYFKLFLIIPFLFLMSCSNNEESINYVDTFIGTGGHGHTYPGATLPFGMVQLSPDTRVDSWDGCSGYHYSDSTIIGFSHTHLSGTGCGDYGDIRLMPTTGKVLLDPGTEETPSSGYRSTFNHKTEKTEPGFYSVKLEDYDIDIELTTTLRSGFHKYKFNKKDNVNIIIDLSNAVTSDVILGLEIEILSDTEIAGLRHSDGWADNQYVYFYAKFSKPFKSYGIAVDGVTNTKIRKAAGKDVKAFVNYSVENREEIFVKVGISSVSIEGAKNNLLSEIPEWDFDAKRQNAKEIWQKSLDKMKVKSNSDDKKVIFYTALYHAMLAPNLYSDVDGKYRGHDNKIHVAEGFDMYTVFSLWDTFRAEHPLFTIIEPERTIDFIKSMISIYEQGGLLPVWELAASETNCMIGYHSIPVIADAYVKGLKDFDIEKAFEAMKKSALEDQFGLEYYKKYGFIPSGKEGESVSKTLEYAYDDWCIAQIAQALGKENDYNEFIERAQFYKNIYDKETGFMRARLNGAFVNPFDPTEVNFNFTEANSWQYSFFAPQDISGLIEISGGKEKFIKKLDELFSASIELSGRHQADITGLIGQYAHGNEPSHHMAFLYSYVGQPWKTQEVVHKILTELYTPEHDGLSGNEDCGQMSAWYVLSASGLYPVTPGDDIYVFGTPLFDEIIIDQGSGKNFIFKAKNVSDKNYYIQSARLNGKPYSKSYIDHKTIIDGGELSFEMDDKPNKEFGAFEQDIPVSEIKDQIITTVPIVSTDQRTFTKELKIELFDNTKDADIYFTLDGSKPDVNSFKYSKPLKLKKHTVLRAFAKKEGYLKSKEIFAEFFKIPGGRSVDIKNQYNSQYTAGGDVALIDFIRGSGNFRTGAWQGYYGVDFEAVVDLGQIQNIHEISAGFLQDQKSWVFMPLEVKFEISTDGKNYISIGKAENDIPEKQMGGIVKEFTIKGFNKKAKYIKLTAENRKICPDWHVGAGGKAWIFIDEIVIK